MSYTNATVIIAAADQSAVKQASAAEITSTETYISQKTGAF